MTAIRAMTDADVPAVADLATQLGYPVDERVVRDRLLRMTGREDRPLGWIHLAETPVLQRGRAVTIHGLVVDEGRRSTGIGARLVAAGEAWSRERGAEAVLVRSRTTRDGAHRFYERLGFRETKRSVVLELPIR